ncbi:MAG: hypothetical protein Q9213_006838 [Squamulea squamosa]
MSAGAQPSPLQKPLNQPLLIWKSPSNYRGLPHGSPSTSSYFSHPPHTYDQYSICFSFIPHRSISGKSLVFGNDFDHPVRDRIPPGFNAAFQIVKWAIDPGIDGDVYADKPYLYGNALSSINVLSVGPKIDKEAFEDGKSTGSEHEEEVITEGGFEGGQEIRDSLNIPASAAARQKWFLGGHERLDDWQWEEGRLYKADFFNPYLDFNEFSLKLPGFSLKVVGYLGGEDYLRYVLKDKDTGEVLFVVVFTLLPKDQVDKDETKTPQPGKSNETSPDDPTGRAFEPKPDDGDEAGAVGDFVLGRSKPFRKRKCLLFGMFKTVVIQHNTRYTMTRSERFPTSPRKFLQQYSTSATDERTKTWSHIPNHRQPLKTPTKRTVISESILSLSEIAIAEEVSFRNLCFDCSRTKKE